MKSATKAFAQKKFLKDIFIFEICHRYDQLVIEPHVVHIQGVIVLVVSNQPAA